ncbi:MAG TPA: helix-turn-helix domain-containing protein [Patescibacteria group bacterium]|nr:helix-turn-helix domain-containing protein [Patescibacteria group bacterium]
MPNLGQKNSTTITLEKLGLGENEAQLYAAMLRHPKSTVQELQTRSPFPRTMLYYVLNRLVQAGLVSAVKEHWRTVYIAESPERLYDLLAEKEKEFMKDAEAVRELIPELKEKYRLAGERPGVRTMEGIDGYKKALDDIIISKPTTVYAYADVVNKKPGIEIREAFDTKRIAKKIQKRVLLFDTSAAREELKKYPYNDFTQFRVITDRLTAFAVDLQLYDGKILYTTYEGREPIAILVEDKMLFEMQKSIFDALWQKAGDATLLSLNT